MLVMITNIVACTTPNLYEYFLVNFREGISCHTDNKYDIHF
jgi:hypothetical protein